MDKNLEMIDRIIDDLAMGKYDSAQEAVDDLIYFGMDADEARFNVSAMETVDVID
jgi:hypothetical protein